MYFVQQAREEGVQK